MRKAAISSAFLMFLAGACGGADKPRPVPTPATDDTANPAVSGETEAPQTLAERYQAPAQRIIEAALGSDEGWNKLAYLADRIGARPTGSAALEKAIAWAVETMRKEGHENVRTDKVMVPHWERGFESARILAPVEAEMVVLGIGASVGTPDKGLRAPVIEIRSFEELEERASEVAGKIVLYNTPMRAWDRVNEDGYGDVFPFRVYGASKAAKHGAVGVMVRSITTHSLRTPHTGGLRYEDGIKKIPAMAITVEDAEHLSRLLAAGETVKVEMKMGARFLPDAESANVLAELRGSEKPEEIVVIGGHIDTWDIGQGAHDDAGGCVMAMQALTILRRLGLQPRRTIRVVLWTNEEMGLRGARAYAEMHADELANHVMALESDSGAFQWRGFKVQGPERSIQQLQEILPLLSELGAAEVKEGFSGADIQPLAAAGVPTLGQWVEDEHYFDYHHTDADTLDKVVPAELKSNIAAMAVVAYVIADMEERFGGDGPRPENAQK